RHVHAVDSIDLVNVDFREDDLLPDTERVVASPVEASIGYAAEVAHARQRQRDEAVQKLVHPGATQRDVAPDGHTLTKLEVRDALPSTGDGRVLARNEAQLLHGIVEGLLILDGVADALVYNDFDEARHLHHILVAEALGERRNDFRLVPLL